jgi:RimJ/RimL family protein N-acetyltransferase
VIRRYEASDAETLFRAVDASRSALLPWIPWAADQHRTVDASLATIQRFDAARADPTNLEFNATVGFVFGVFLRDSGALVGGTGFNRIDFPAHEAETGYWVHAEHQRRGIASAVLRAMLSWAFAPQDSGGWGFRRIRVFAAADNLASCAIPRKLGLREECRIVKHRWTDGLGWTDTLGWGVLADEWGRLEPARP